MSGTTAHDEPIYPSGDPMYAELESISAEHGTLAEHFDVVQASQTGG